MRFLRLLRSRVLLPRALDEAGAASAIRGLGSEPCGASRGYDDCGQLARAPSQIGSALRELTPTPNAKGPGVPGPHRTAREPIPSAATGRCETRESRRFLDDFYRSRRRIVTETHGLLARHRRAAALHLATPFVAARRCTRTGPKLPIDWLYTRRLGFGIRANAHAEQSSSVPVAR